jgi:hypothetical protein
MTQQPTVGRVVHYQSYGTPGGEFTPEPRAAIITEVDACDDSAVPGICDTGHIGCPRVGLCVLNPTGQYFNRDVPYAPEPTPGHWNWPPRVGPAS